MIGVAICCFSNGTKRLQGKRLRVVECFLKVMEKKRVAGIFVIVFLTFCPFESIILIFT